MSVESRSFCEIVRGNSHSLINAALFADTGRNCISLEAVRLSCLDTLEAHRAKTAENVSAYLKSVNLVRTVVLMH